MNLCKDYDTFNYSLTTCNCWLNNCWLTSLPHFYEIAYQQLLNATAYFNTDSDYDFDYVLFCISFYCSFQVTVPGYGLYNGNIKETYASVIL